MTTPTPPPVGAPGAPEAGADGSHRGARAFDRLVAVIEPAHLVIVALIVAAVGLTVRPITDVDTWWHVLIGREIVETGRIGGLGNDWAAFGDSGWRTSQWLSEVVMAGAEQLAGWSGILWLRLALIAALFVSLTAVLLRRATAGATAAVLALVVVAAGLLQERPLLAALLFLVWLGAASGDLLLEDRVPRGWVVALATCCWANLHGTWVLAPAAFALVAIGALIDTPRRRTTAIHAARSAGLALIAGCVTPLGPLGLLLPFSFRSATVKLQEWEVPELLVPQTIAVLAIVLCIVVMVARGPSRPSDRAVLLVTAGWALFAATAYRNLLPAALILAPIAAAHLSRARWARQRIGPQELRQALVVVSCLLALIGTAFAVFATATTDPLAKANALAIARTLDASDAQGTVLNDYNTAGVLATFGGPGIRVAIDGRADRYGGGTITDYVDATQLKGEWESVVDRIDPRYVVLLRTAPLTSELVEARGWKVVRTEGQLVLLQAPPAGFVPRPSRPAAPGR